MYVVVLLASVSLCQVIYSMRWECLDIKCPQCSDGLRLFDPVCASNQISYPNLCWVDCYNSKLECGGEQEITITKRGRCPMTVRPKRLARATTTIIPTPEETNFESGIVCHLELCTCPTDYNPICASDGVTYYNSCYFRCARKCFRDLEFVTCGYCSLTRNPSRLCLARFTHEII